MKDFRKEKGLFICEECGKGFTCKESVSKHVKRYHNLFLNDYYEKWFKEQGDCFCKECGKPISIKQKYCSIKCKQRGAGKQRSNNAKINNKLKKEKLQQAFKFICLECNEKFESSIKFHNHIIKYHDIKEYYDKFLRKESEGKCKICGNSTKFTGKLEGNFSGYMMCCSKKCSNKYRFIKRSETNMKKYGVKNPFESPKFIVKIQETNMKKYGVKYASQTKETQEKGRLTNLKNNGVNWPTQNKDILEKGQKSAKTLKQFNEKLWYQGTYELDFLEKYYNKYPDIQRGPSIKYGKRTYHPDFYIPSLNLIVEIKSSWTLNKKEEEQKRKATIKKGFNYFMILYKKYPNFL